MVQESSTAVYAFMENLFAKDFPGLLQLMGITLYMLVEILRSSVTGRGDPSEFCSCTSLPTKANHDKTTVMEKLMEKLMEN